MERFERLTFENLLTFRFYFLDLRVKLWFHCVLLPYLFSFFSYYLRGTLQTTLNIFGFSCPYEHPFFPYFEYCFLFFVVLIYFRLYINILLLNNKQYLIGLLVYFLVFTFFLIWCDWYAYIHPVWNIAEQKYIYTLNFNIFGAAFIFFYCLFPFFILDIFLILFFFYPLISLGVFVFSISLFGISDITYPELWRFIHNLLNEMFLAIKNLFTAECMQSNPTLFVEKPINAPSVAETKSEVLPKTALQRTGEYIGDYRFEQKRVECGETGVSVHYKPTPEGCRVSVVQCLPLNDLSEAADAAIKNNLPAGYKGTLIDHAIGDTIRTATKPGIETSIELKETRCREISSSLLKSLKDYKKAF